MLKFYYNPVYKYTNRTIIDTTGDTNYTEKDYENIDSPDTINGHIIYTLGESETIPTYVVDTVSGWKWFVSGITQKRTGKYQISLLRDIISESPDTWKQEQAYITAGTATNYNKYKRWNLPYTNTKISQQRLNFGGKSSFFVFYVNEQNTSGPIITEDDLEIKYTTIPGVATPDFTVNDLTEISNIAYVDSGTYVNLGNSTVKVRTKMYKNGGQLTNDPNQAVVTWEDRNGTLRNDPSVWDSGPVDTGNLYKMEAVNVDMVKTNTSSSLTNFETAINNWYNTYKTTFGNTISNSSISSLNAYVDKTILDLSTNKVYIMRLATNNLNLTGNVSNSDTSTLRSALSNISWPTASGYTSTFATVGNYFVSYTQKAVSYTYTLEQIGSSTSLDFNFTAGVRKLPKSAVRCVNIVSDANHNDEEIAQCLMLAQTNGINPDNTTGRILDIQYLPFSIATTTDSNLKINSQPLTAQFLDLDDYVYSLDLADLTNINKETDTIKIVSPSRASQYLFRPYDNDGNMKFGIKATLKPYTSTIYVRPSTEGLLMTDWDDKDCLIIQEDFSLTNVTSEWTQYVYNNRTYLNAFERQMQGREYERGWERQVEQAQAKSDEWNARNISAQKARTYTGNIPIISGIAAAIGSAWQDQDYMAAAQLDREYNEALYQEGMSLSRDLFEYQLENIKSQPLIPSKVTTIDCKFLDGVYLEYYSTNDTELNAIRNFYRYNGNRIDDYGTFSDYWGNFIKGKIIISQNYTQPEIDELNRRLSMGIFTGGAL